MLHARKVRTPSHDKHDGQSVPSRSLPTSQDRNSKPSNAAKNYPGSQKYDKNRHKQQPLHTQFPQPYSVLQYHSIESH
jgi:hypothetical protein